MDYCGDDFHDEDVRDDANDNDHDCGKNYVDFVLVPKIMVLQMLLLRSSMVSTLPLVELDLLQ